MTTYNVRKGESITIDFVDTAVLRIGTEPLPSPVAGCTHLHTRLLSASANSGLPQSIYYCQDCHATINEAEKLQLPGCAHLDSYLWAPSSMTTNFQNMYRCRDCHKVLEVGALLEAWSLEIQAMKEGLKRLSVHHHPDGYHFMREHR